MLYSESMVSVFALFLCYWVWSVAGSLPILGVPPTPSSITFPQDTVFSKVATTPGKLRIVENSGICETTPGVYQASGYGDIAANQSIWFWFFAARNNPDSAPLSLWFSGGPGSSSMHGLFQEHGPCRIANDSRSVFLNPNSWNNNSNILYIDQPVGTGFSHGALEIGTSQEAAADVWTFLQIFLSDSRFSNYSTRKLALWTESYGGHYGPTFATYFLSQNAAIAAGNASGLALNLKVLGIGNGLTDPLSQYPGYLSYAANNPYHPTVNSSIIALSNATWTSGGCKDNITACYDGASDSVCSHAQSFCNARILTPLVGDFDLFDVRSASNDPYPVSFTSYLNGIASTIGADTGVRFILSNSDVKANFAQTGDWMRNSRPDLEAIINAGIRTIIYDGDADYMFNFMGVEAMVDNLNTQFSSTYAQQSFQNYVVDGQIAGLLKNAGTFSYLRVFGAGHEVPAYNFGNLSDGQAAAQMFDQIMNDQSLSSTSPQSTPSQPSTATRRQLYPMPSMLALLLLTIILEVYY